MRVFNVYYDAAVGVKVLEIEQHCYTDEQTKLIHDEVRRQLEELGYGYAEGVIGTVYVADPHLIDILGTVHVKVGRSER